MKPYLWMMDYTPQHEWIDRQGLLLWLAFYFSEIGAGLYLTSLFFEFWRGYLVGWLIAIILGGGCHLLYLGNPFRAWRAMMRPFKSELSRGIIFMIILSAVGVIHIVTSSGMLPQWSAFGAGIALKAVVAILCIIVMIHGYLTFTVINAIAFWNSAILPVISLASALWLGTQLALLIGLDFSQTDIFLTLESVARWSLLSYCILSLYYLWSVGHASSAGRHSLQVILNGDLSVLFYPGVCLVGFAIPIGITFHFYVSEAMTNPFLVYTRIFCAITGDLFFRYIISKAGRYSPLIYSNRARI